jgi:hypothetical protein
MAEGDRVALDRTPQGSEEAAMPANVVRLYQGWTLAEQEALRRLFADLQARRVADHWETAETELGDPQFFVFSEHCPDAVLAVSRVWRDGRRTYVIESRHGQTLAADRDLETGIHRACHQRRGDGRAAGIGDHRFFEAVIAYFGVGAAQVLGFGSTELLPDELMLDVASWAHPLFSALA